MTVIIDITQLTPGTVKTTDVYPAVDVTDVTQSPTGTTKKYDVSQLLTILIDSLGLTTYGHCITGSTANYNATYNNGLSGVGATLTNAGAKVAFTINGLDGVVNGRYLIKDQTNPAQNGIYTLTTLGDTVSINWVLTRAIDFNSSANITNNAVVFSVLGVIDPDTLWEVTFISPVVVGTTAINWSKFSFADVVLLNPATDQDITAHNLQLSAGEFISGSVAGGFAGSLLLYSPTAANGRLIITASDSASNFSMSITNAAFGQTTTVTIPDPVSSTANFLLSKTQVGQVQHITVGSLGIDAGGLQSGLATGGTIGNVVLFSTTAAKGVLSIESADNVGNFVGLLTNASLSAARTWTLPNATGTLALTSDISSTAVLLSPAGNQIILSNNLTLAAGILTLGTTAGGIDGALILYPNAASAGGFRILNNTVSAFSATLKNSSVGQSTTYTIPDPGAATANVVVAPALVSGNAVKASGTAGLVVDAGYALHAGTTAPYAGGGTSNAFVTTNMTAASIVTATILAQTNAASIVTAVPGVNTLIVTFSADPGANTTINWISTTAVA